MTSITTRAGKGSPLTHNEVDANFTSLNTDKLDTAGIALGSAASPTIKFTGDTNTGIYSPGADQLAVSTGGTGRLFIDNSGRVGIGTSSPGAKLHVVGSAGTNFGVSDGSAYGLRIDNGIAYGLTGSTIHGVDQTFFGSYQPLTLNGSQLGFAIGGTERLRIDSSGRVGIGTSNPGANHILEIEGGQKYLAVRTNAGAGGAANPSSSDGLFFTWNRSNGGGESNIVYGTGLGTSPGLTFGSWNGTTYAEAIRIDSSGNVGIGTSSPAGRLHVNGGDSLFGSGSLIRLLSGGEVIDFANGAQDAYVNGRISGSTLKLYGNNGSGIDIDSSGNVGIGTSSPGTTLEISSGAGSSPNLSGTSGNLAITQPGLLTSLQIGGYGTTPYALWLQGQNKSGSAFPISLNPLGGNVGIGTSSPGKPLDVRGTGSVNVGSFSNGNQGIDIATTASGGSIQTFDQNQTLDLKTFGTTTNSINFSVGNTERLRIDSSGNVGIGTSSPAHKLDVAGGVNSTGLNVTGFGGFFNAANKFGVDNNAGATRMYSSGPDASTRGSYDFRATDSVGTLDTSRMVIDSSGNVGIGTSSVQARFQVETNIANTTGQRVALFAGTGAGDAAYEAVGCVKFDNNTTTSQVFHRFYINGGTLGSGQINANGVGAAAFGGYSDIRLKENIANISPQLQNICSLRPVEFDYKDGSGHQIGFIAQEIEEIYPDVVATGLDDMLTVTGWSKTEARLVKAFQEAIARIETLEAEVAALKGA